MRRNRKKLKKINSKFVLVIFFITMFLFGTSYAILSQELTLNGNVKIYVDEGTDLTVTNFNTSIDPIYTQTIFGFPISGYKVVGITIQNSLSKTINNWTIEFTSNRQVATKPNDNRLSAYLNSENAYDSATYSNGTVIVKGSDTLAPGETKTVYVFFNVNIFTNNFSFGDPKAYYTPSANGARFTKSNLNTRSNSSNEPVLFDINSSDTFAIQICYDTILVADNLYSTTMYIFIVNNTGTDVTNIKFDVSYKERNQSNLYSSTINILENNESGASFLSNDVINQLSYKGYIVTGLKTYGSFNGMTINNISYTNVNGESTNTQTEPTEIKENPITNEIDNIEKEINTNTTNTVNNPDTNTITENSENVINQNSIQNEIVTNTTINTETNTIIDNEIDVENTSNTNTVTNENGER